jgi:hydrophobic/amphiphilic exporter-1 (mainly G- bacteria), HAE1 family
VNLPELALRRPVTLLMVYATLFILGAVAVHRIPLEFLPTLAGPHFWIQIPYRNATPAEVEKTISIPAEELLQTVPNLSRVDSISLGNASGLHLEFDWGTDMDYAYLEVKDRLDRLKAQLPRESQEYYIWRFSSSDMEVLFLSFTWDGPVEELYETVNEKVKPRLQRVDGVGSVAVWGQEPKKVFIDLDQDLLKGYGVSLYDLVLKLERNNFNLASGEVLDAGTSYLVRSMNEYRSLEDLEDFRVNQQGLRLKDVARVRYGYPEQTYITRMDGKSTVLVGIKKESNANTVEVCGAVQSEMDRLLAEPSYSRLGCSVVFDQSRFIMNSFRDLRSAGLWGGFFAVCVLYFFLRRVLATCVVAVAIPISIMVAVMAMFFGLMTLNVISMVGLMLGVGMLVDNSIVVSENIFRLREQGMGAAEASRVGSRDVAMAILASTLTTIIVFLPIVFMDMGMMKIYTREVGIAISLSLLASLFVALTFIPLVASRLPQERPRPSRFLEGLVAGYRRRLKWVLDHPSQSFCLLVALIVLTILVPVRKVPQKGESAGDTRRVLIDLRIKGAQERERVLDPIEAIEGVLFARREDLDIAHVLSRSGQMGGSTRIHVLLREDDGARLPTEEAQRRILDVLPSLPDVEARIPEHGSPYEAAESEVEILLKGDDPRRLEGISSALMERIARIEGVLKVDSDMEPGFDEVQVEVDRSLAKKYRVNPMVAAQTIAFGLRGYSLKKMKTGEREIDVLIQLEPEDRQDVSKLKDLQLLTEDGKLIPIGVVARFRESPGQDVIRRSEGKRTVRVRAQTSGEALGILKERMERALGEMRLPPGYSAEFGQSVMDLEKTKRAFGSALILSILLIYFLLGGLFESYVHPLTILVSVPLALIGSYWVMYLTGSALDVAAFIGLILMVGIVVNNAIVIVDHVNRIRRSGINREEAILQAGQDRIRPVLMTAATTILGLIPLAFGGSGLGGVVMFAPLGKAVMGGLALSTLLTLFVVPLFYTYVEDLGGAVGRLVSLALRRGVRGQAGKTKDERAKAEGMRDPGSGLRAPAPDP